LRNLVVGSNSANLSTTSQVIAEKTRKSKKEIRFTRKQKKRRGAELFLLVSIVLAARDRIELPIRGFSV